MAVQGAGFIGIISGGAISDRLLRAGWSPQFARVRFPGISDLGVTIPCGGNTGSFSDDVRQVLAPCSILFTSAISGYTTVAEFNPPAGAIFGVMSMLGSFAGILAR